MRKLLLKEFVLAMHPTSIIFIFLSALLIIPNYPYYVTFFYTSLAVFFTCLNGRENNDIFYTISLPVRKKDIVKSRFCFVIILQLIQVLAAIPFALLRQSFNIPGNQVGIEANVAFFGLSLIMLGLFNLIFFNIYYKDVTKVGTALVASSIVMFAYMSIAETCVHVVPFARDYLDTKDTQYLSYKMVILAAGIIIYALLTSVSYIKSVKSFEALDL